MLKICLAGIFSLMVLTPVGPAHAYYLTSSKLLEFCSKVPTPASTNAGTSDALANECYGYITGVADALELEGDEGDYSWVADCIPEKVVPYQLTQGVVQYLRAHPENHHHSAALEVIKAFDEAWCKH